MKKVLIVDDSITIQKMVTALLVELGFEAIAAGDGEEAIKICHSFNFDLVITDINMPKIDGIKLVKTLRESSQYQFTPILILTTEHTIEMKQQCIEAGATGWINKPFDPEEFVKIIQQVT